MQVCGRENYRSMQIFMLNFTFMRKISKKTDLCDVLQIYDENYRFMFVLKKKLWFRAKRLQIYAETSSFCRSMCQRLENNRRMPNIYRYMQHCWNYLLIALIYGLLGIQGKHNAEMVRYFLCSGRQIWIQMFNNSDLTLSTLSVQFTLWDSIRNEVIGYTTDLRYSRLHYLTNTLAMVKDGCWKNVSSRVAKKKQILLS